MLTLAEAKAQLNEKTNAHDEEIKDYIDAVTAVVEYHTGDVVEPRPVTEYHRVRSSSQLLLRSHPLVSLTSIARVDGSRTWDVADLHVDESLGEITVLAGPRLDGFLEVVVRAGHDPVPENYNLAARIIVQHLWKTQRGVAGAAFAGGMATALGEGTTGFAIPRRAEQLLGSPMPGVA